MKQIQHGVVVGTKFGMIGISTLCDRKPTVDDVKDWFAQKHYEELKRKHLPVQGYCLNQKKESERIMLVTKHRAVLQSINEGNYVVGRINKI